MAHIKKTANMEIQRKNFTDIFQLFLQNERLTKQNIVNTLHLSLPTVTQNINALCQQGLLCEAGTQGNTGGRRAMTYSFAADARIAIGVDITRNHVAIVAVDLRGSVFYKERVRKKFERTDAYYRYLGDMVQHCIAQIQCPEDRILGVGIGVPGLVTADNQTVFYGEILQFTGETCANMSRYIPYPTALLNDANAAGFAETWINRDIKTAFYLMLSNNIGGAVIIDGAPYSGYHHHSGEVGHLCIERNGRQCYCGQRGCVDRYLAATELSDLTDGRIADFFALLEKKDPRALSCWDTYLDDLALTNHNVHMLFDCPIILGGYVGEFIAPYMDEIRRRTAALDPFESTVDYLYACHYRTEAIAAGSALHFIVKFLETV